MEFGLHAFVYIFSLRLCVYEFKMSPFQIPFKTGKLNTEFIEIMADGIYIFQLTDCKWAHVCRIYYRFERIFFCSNVDVNKHLLWRIYWRIEWYPIVIGKRTQKKNYVCQSIEWNLWCDQSTWTVAMNKNQIHLNFFQMVAQSLIFPSLVYHFMIGKTTTSLSKH